MTILLRAILPEMEDAETHTLRPDMMGTVIGDQDLLLLPTDKH